jgi:oligoendopeptidase F
MPTDFAALPATAQEFSAWTWPQIAPYYDDLLARPLSAANVNAWLADWSRLAALLDEVSTRFTIATTVNTADEETARSFNTFLDEIVPPMQAAEQRVKEKLIASGLEPAGFAVPLRKLRTDAELFRETNVPLLSEARKLNLEYDGIAGARTVEWDGAEIPSTQLSAYFYDPDRALRERAWRAYYGRIQQDTPALADLWRRMIATRAALARNAGLPNYREYRWRQLYRFDYTPDDAKRFNDAIAEVVVPAASRAYARRRQRLGAATLRPWDVYVSPYGGAALKPYATIAELEEKTANVFRQVEPDFAGYFETMRAEGLLDLDSRANKAPGGYSVPLAVAKRPFIFANSVGSSDDVDTLLHEGGHAFHTFEAAHLPYAQQWLEAWVPAEFAEVASMGMELLGSRYLTKALSSFYTEAEAARARIDKLDTFLTFWPYMAMIDSLQHWVYEHEDESGDIARCDDLWAALEDRFRPAWDWSGMEAEKRQFWHRQGHVFQDPFYYIEYGLAQLGAVQIYANALRDPTGAVAAYRHALTLGGTAPLPELFAAAGARFAFDAETLRAAVSLLEKQMAALEPVAEGTDS